MLVELLPLLSNVFSPVVRKGLSPSGPQVKNCDLQTPKILRLEPLLRERTPDEALPSSLMADLHRNDPCHCGSGKKYKKCCLKLEEGRAPRERLIAESTSLFDKNSALVEAAFEIFGLTRPWTKVKADFCDAQIREFYTFIANLWPLHTDFLKLLPEPDSSLRALYMGENEPEAMLENVFRFCLYADQIYLLNPFENPNVVAEQYNPILHPGEWRLQTLRLIFHLVLLAPWIGSGLVVLIPDPGDFDRNLRVKTWDLARTRLKGWKPTKADIDASLIKRRTIRTLSMAPREYLERKARETCPELSDDKIREVIDSFERERREDPLLLDSTLDQMPGQMMAARLGGNLELGTYICQAIGAFPYTNLKIRWKEIMNAQDLGPAAEVWTPLTKAFQQLDFRFLDKIDSQFACSIRTDGRLEGFRGFLRRVWNAIGGEPELSKAEVMARDFRDDLMQAFNEAKADWDKIDRDLLKWGGAKLAGAVAAGHLSPLFSAGFALAGITELIDAQRKRRESRRKVPMSVLIDLENQ